MEAMWIKFDCQEGQVLAVRPFLGGVNGISGEANTGDMASMLRRINKVTPNQDYIILPDQMWLDGISTTPGIVKQFVATEMAPRREKDKHDARTPRSSMISKSQGHKVSQHDESDRSTPVGASLEWQVTGKDSVGGIQLQVIPRFETVNMFAGSVQNVCKRSSTDLDLISYDDSLLLHAQCFDVLNIPRDEGLREGDVFHIKNMRTQLQSRPKIIGDIRNETKTPISSADALELEWKYWDVEKCTFKVRLPTGGKPPLFLEVRKML
jgi:hypothetical protein